MTSRTNCTDTILARRLQMEDRSRDLSADPVEVKKASILGRCALNSLMGIVGTVRRIKEAPEKFLLLRRINQAKDRHNAAVDAGATMDVLYKTRDAVRRAQMDFMDRFGTGYDI